MLKPAKELYQEIVNVDDYLELMGAPNDTFGEKDQQLLYRLIKQATTQFDSLVSPFGQVGTLYNWWNNLKDTDEDNSKGLRLQKAICSWVETMVQNGKFWVDGLPQMSSNIEYNINSSSSNSNIEAKRKDIIQDLAAIGLTKTNNFGNNNNYNNELTEQECEELLITTKNYLINNYLNLDSMGNNQFLKSGINMRESPLTNAGDITNENPNKHIIRNYRLVGCDLLGGDGNDIELEKCNKILDPEDGLYKFINQFNVNYFGGLTEEQINYRIAASGSLYNHVFIYNKGFIVMFQQKTKKSKSNNVYGFALSLQDNNIGHDPNDSPDYWEILPSNPTDINAVVEYIKKYIDDTIVPKLSNETIPNIVDEKLNNLDSAKIINEYKYRILMFNDEIEYNDFKTTTNTDDSYFQDVNIKETDVFTDGNYMMITNESSNWVKIGTSGSNDKNVKYSNSTGEIIKLNYNITSNETETGNFFNGKPIYVKYFENIPHGRHEQPDIEKVIDFRAFSKSNANNFWYSKDTAYSQSGQEFGLEWFQDQNMWKIYNDSNNSQNYMIIYYTKKGE